MDAISAFLERFKPPADAPNESWAGLLRGSSGEKTVQVWGATTEELATDTTRPALARVAQDLLRPEMTFYQVDQGEFDIPFFYWDGEGWRTLGEAWQAFP